MQRVGEPTSTGTGSQLGQVQQLETYLHHGRNQIGRRVDQALNPLVEVRIWIGYAIGQSIRDGDTQRLRKTQVGTVRACLVPTSAQLCQLQFLFWH